MALGESQDAFEALLAAQRPEFQGRQFQANGAGEDVLWRLVRRELRRQTFWGVERKKTHLGNIGVGLFEGRRTKIAAGYLARVANEKGGEG